MNRIPFKNGQAPYISDVTLNKLQDNIDDAKVEKEVGKGLSTNDYTTAEKTKLAGIATEATKNTVENVLTSISTSNALSAYQGRILNEKITNFSGSKSKDGYTTLPNGLKIQWGIVSQSSFSAHSASGGYSYTKTFPIAFTSFCNCYLTAMYPAGHPNLAILSESLEQLQIGCNAKLTDLYVNWLAIGI